MPKWFASCSYHSCARHFVAETLNHYIARWHLTHWMQVLPTGQDVVLRTGLFMVRRTLVLQGICRCQSSMWTQLRGWPHSLGETVEIFLEAGTCKTTQGTAAALIEITATCIRCLWHLPSLRWWRSQRLSWVGRQDAVCKISWNEASIQASIETMLLQVFSFSKDVRPRRLHSSLAQRDMAQIGAFLDAATLKASRKAWPFFLDVCWRESLFLSPSHALEKELARAWFKVVPDMH